MPEAVIVSTARTPIGRAAKGSLVDARPDDLAAFAIRAALDKVPELPRGETFCERTVALTSTSTFGTVYDASPRMVVWNGWTSRQLRRSFIVPRFVNVAAVFTVPTTTVPSNARAISQESVTDRPVCVPNCSVRPWRTTFANPSLPVVTS